MAVDEGGESLAMKVQMRRRDVILVSTRCTGKPIEREREDGCDRASCVVDVEPN